MIISVGEILADLIGKEKNGLVTYERYAGGAPFNVACGLKKLGVKCGFCGCVGDDLIGDFLSGFAKRQGFDYLCCKKSGERNTTLAFVELDEAGERKFSFFRKNTADFMLPQEETDTIAQLADIVHIGSLPLSEKEGRDFADRLIRKAALAGKKVSFDVNYRDDIFASEQEAVRIYKKYIDLADIVKFSEEEIALFACGQTVAEMLEDLDAEGKKIIFVTLGAKGSMVSAYGKIYSQPALKIDAVDTTGAGDAFFAGVLSALGSGSQDWPAILRKGNVCGALTACGKGAIDAFPDRDKVEQLTDKV